MLIQSMYDEIQKIISDAGEDVDFADFGHGISKEWIALAESRLGVVFPDSYKWWLRNYSGGEVYGEEIYSIYGLDFDIVVGGDIVYINELNRKASSDYNDKLIICESDDAMFYFDLSQGMKGGEYPVYEYFSKTCYAENFIAFLKRRILEV